MESHCKSQEELLQQRGDTVRSWTLFSRNYACHYANYKNYIYDYEDRKVHALFVVGVRLQLSLSENDDFIKCNYDKLEENNYDFIKRYF